MTIRIKAPRAWFDLSPGYKFPKSSKYEIPYRIVRESDWRKLMKLVRAVEAAPFVTVYPDVLDAIYALKEKAK